MDIKSSPEYAEAIEPYRKSAAERLERDLNRGYFDFSPTLKKEYTDALESLRSPYNPDSSGEKYIDYGFNWDSADDASKRLLAASIAKSVSNFTPYSDSIANRMSYYQNLLDSIDNLRTSSIPKYINRETGQEVPFGSKSEVNAKQYLISPDGAALFLHGYNNDPEDVKVINSFLREHPAYPVLLDNGRFSHYQIGNGNVKKYIQEGRVAGFPDEKMYIQGIVKKDGGKIQVHRFQEGGIINYIKFFNY